MSAIKGPIYIQSLPLRRQGSTAAPSSGPIFQQACKDKKHDLFVLPPKRPQLNDHVERPSSHLSTVLRTAGHQAAFTQGSWRYEFYACFDLPSRLDNLQPLVDAFAHRFDHHRPRRTLGGQTPAQHFKTISSGDQRPSRTSRSRTRR